jgi:hypothetical protein
MPWAWAEASYTALYKEYEIELTGCTGPRLATREEMSEAKLPLAYRDSCAHLLIPLNKCRHKTWYAPWKCVVGYERASILDQTLMNDRTKDMATKSVNTRSSWSGLQKWTKSGQNKPLRVRIEHDQALLLTTGASTPTTVGST